VKNKFVFDSYALFSYFQEERGADRVGEILRAVDAGKSEVFLSTINWGEIFYCVRRRKGERAGEGILVILDQLPIELVDPDRDLVYRAVRLKSEFALSYADCFAAALAEREKATLVSGDKEFEPLKSRFPIIWIW
jgi:ribonuclease VapC